MGNIEKIVTGEEHDVFHGIFALSCFAVLAKTLLVFRGLHPVLYFLHTLAPVALYISYQCRANLGLLTNGEANSIGAPNHQRYVFY